jgi:pimeloyl-ACP methyl ester carboxylesterase
MALSGESQNVIPTSNSKVLYKAQQFKGTDGQPLFGHLALPTNQPGPFPAVLLLLGSGAHNRYENIPASKSSDGKPVLLFKRIEDALTAKGIAVFAYDKRGVAPKDNSFQENTVGEAFRKASAETFVSDAIAAYDQLKTLKEIDSKRLGILGHSEGTTIAIKVAESRPDVHAIFMMALYTRSPAEMQYYQDVSASMRIFYLLDHNQNGYVEKSEYRPFSEETDWPFLSETGKHLNWEEILTLFEATNEGKISEQRWRFKLESDHRRDISLIMSDTSPWPGNVSRAWYREYLKEGKYLDRHSAFCERLHVFHGEADVLSPFEDAMELKTVCDQKKKPLASFHDYPDLGHCFSRRNGLRNWRDTYGPIEQNVLVDLATTAQRALEK